MTDDRFVVQPGEIVFDTDLRDRLRELLAPVIHAEHGHEMELGGEGCKCAKFAARAVDVVLSGLAPSPGHDRRAIETLVKIRGARSGEWNEAYQNRAVVHDLEALALEGLRLIGTRDLSGHLQCEACGSRLISWVPNPPPGTVAGFASCPTCGSTRLGHESHSQIPICLACRRDLPID